jgi:hypothetical protein
MGSHKMGGGSFMLRHDEQVHAEVHAQKGFLFCSAECITNHDMCDTVKILYRHSCIANLQI